jgi:hypothetical protein
VWPASATEGAGQDPYSWRNSSSRNYKMARVLKYIYIFKPLFCLHSQTVSNRAQRFLCTYIFDGIECVDHSCCLFMIFCETSKFEPRVLPSIPLWRSTVPSLSLIYLLKRRKMSDKQNKIYSVRL